MTQVIVRSAAPIGLIGGGEMPQGALDEIAGHADVWVCADGGLVHAAAAGLTPCAVIGDMDSVPPDLLAQLPEGRVHPVAEQDTTDFEKCLMRLEAPLIVAAGMLGGRLDHQLASLHALVAHAHVRCVLVGAGEIAFVCPPALALDLAPDTAVSLFPLLPVTARARGLAYSFEDLELAPGRRIGTSNWAEGPVSLEVSGPGLICLLPRACLGVAVTQLVGRPG